MKELEEIVRVCLLFQYSDRQIRQLAAQSAPPSFPEYILMRFSMSTLGLSRNYSGSVGPGRAFRRGPRASKTSGSYRSNLQGFQDVCFRRYDGHSPARRPRRLNYLPPIMGVGQPKGPGQPPARQPWLRLAPLDWASRVMAILERKGRTRLTAAVTPRGTTNMALLPAEWGEKNSVTSSS